MSKEETAESKGFLSSALLVAAVAVVMILGTLLKTDVSRQTPPPAATRVPAEALALGAAVTPELAPAAAVAAAPYDEPDRSPPVDPLVSRLAARAEDDSGRLAKARGRWTAQLLVACKPETVDRVLANVGGSRDLYVLPAEVNDDPCFRVCFGTYASSKEAAAALDLPKVLRGKDRIGAVEIVKVLP